MKHTLTLAAAACALLLVTAPAQAVVIDLNSTNFFADSTTFVLGTAIMVESSVTADALLSNIPSLGEPEVIIAGVGTILSFDYSGFNPTDLGDTFTAYIVDSLTTFSVGAPFEYTTTSAGAGSVSFDLSALVGTTLGLEFHLTSSVYNATHPTTVTVSNLQLLEAPTAVPEPGTMAMFGLGLAGLGFARRRKTA